MKYLLLILATAITFCSCDRNNYALTGKLNCPPYDVTFLNTWFPYEQGATYYYKGNVDYKHWLKIDTVGYLDGDEQLGCVVENECLPSGIISAHRDKSLHNKIWFNVIHGIGSMYGEQVTLVWNSDNVYLKVNDDGTLVPDPLYYDRQESFYQERKPVVIHHTELWLNEVLYTDVYEIHPPLKDYISTRKLYLAKGHGIVGFQTVGETYFWKE